MTILIWCARLIAMLLVGGLGALYVRQGDDFHLGIGMILLVQVMAWLDGAMRMDPHSRGVEVRGIRQPPTQVGREIGR